jgi:hypothetical protein
MISIYMARKLFLRFRAHTKNMFQDFAILSFLCLYTYGPWLFALLGFALDVFGYLHVI